MSKEGAFRYIRVHSGTFGFIRVHLVSFATHEMLGKRNKNAWELLLVEGSFCATAFSFYNTTRHEKKSRFACLSAGFLPESHDTHKGHIRVT